MSEENVEIVREGYEYFNRFGEPPFHIFAKEIVLMESDATPVGGEIFEGHDGVARALGQLVEAFDDLRFDVERLIEVDDKVVSFITLTGRGAASGVPVEVRFAHVLKLRDGLLIEWQVHQTREGALEAAGLSES
jgi:ketosteroid isomerase-like protein